ncbi:MAG: hypothetical protein A3F67_08360 [Verrucomicrobia bacterium RIFCSPHIGHO2_12_FULL_41_10]|nr:MAG: hypothetical protein A3F67_08360 [Verrucomicrobia bacterium RIFCSPHIGHO2_12_FULL_41_10]
MNGVQCTTSRGQKVTLTRDADETKVMALFQDFLNEMEVGRHHIFSYVPSLQSKTALIMEFGLCRKEGFTKPDAVVLCFGNREMQNPEEGEPYCRECAELTVMKKKTYYAFTPEEFAEGCQEFKTLQRWRKTALETACWNDLPEEIQLYVISIVHDREFAEEYPKEMYEIEETCVSHQEFATYYPTLRQFIKTHINDPIIVPAKESMSQGIFAVSYCLPGKRTHGDELWRGADSMIEICRKGSDLVSYKRIISVTSEHPKSIDSESYSMGELIEQIASEQRECLPTILDLECFEKMQTLLDREIKLFQMEM